MARFATYRVYQGSCNGGHVESRHGTAADALAHAARLNRLRRRENRKVRAVYVAVEARDVDALVEVGSPRPWVHRAWTPSLHLVLRCRDRAAADALASRAEPIAQGAAAEVYA